MSKFVTMVGGVMAAALILVDEQILLFVHANDTCKPIFEVITEVGRSHWYLVPAGLIFILGFKKAWRIKIWYESTLVFFAVASSGIIINILKPIFARARPREYLRHDVTGFFHWPEILAGKLSDYNSFPSGHAATALSAAVAIVLCLPEKYRWFRLPVLVTGGVIAVSRVMVSAHYASDVLAGALIGIWAAVLCKNYLARASWAAKFAATISKP
jgi:membrane-associated phospholipid phosphatase